MIKSLSEAEMTAVKSDFSAEAETYHAVPRLFQTRSVGRLCCAATGQAAALSAAGLFRDIGPQPRTGLGNLLSERIENGVCGSGNDRY